MTDFEKMKKAYDVSSKILEKKMEKERPLDLEILRKVKESAIIVVAGQYDKIELVLDLIKVPYVLIYPSEVDKLELSTDQILIINCPGNLSDGALDKIKTYVKNGGFLFTTDWALLNVLEKLFPEKVRYNKMPTRDDCVAVEVVDKGNKFLEGLFTTDEQPIWWLETSSYPIEIVNKGEVKVLVISKEMQEKYGQAPIVITFDYGAGTVLHMTSHYYLQRAELRTKRHATSAKEYAEKEMGLSEKDIDMDKLKEVSLGEAEAAYSSAQFISNVIIEKQKQVIEKEKRKEVKKLEIEKETKKKKK